MHILIAIIVAFLVGAALATVYHTRVEPVAKVLRREAQYARSDVIFWKEEALKAKAALLDLRQRIEAKAAELGKKL